MTGQALSRRDERGLALVMTIAAVGLLLALSLALVLVTTTELGVAANQTRASEALYAAEAVLGRILPDLAATADWDGVLAGSLVSSVSDGAPSGIRSLGGDETIDLGRETATLRCGRPVACGDADMDAAPDSRPWGRNNPRWQIYAHGPVTAFVGPGAADPSFYAVVWAGDDPLENDDDPVRDGGPPASGSGANPGRARLALVARVYGAGGTRRGVSVVIARAVPGALAQAAGAPAAVLRLVSWRDLRVP